MDIRDELKKHFEKFPGIGPRQANRFVYALLAKDQKFQKRLASLINSLGNEIRTCTTCMRFFPKKGNHEQCVICTNEERSPETLLVVERDVDLENIERAGRFRGRYFVIGGTLPLLIKNHTPEIRSNELAAHVQKQGEKGILKEIILALSATPQGEHTAVALREILNPIADRYHVKITELGRGISTGTELEYADQDTITYALENRI